MSENTDELIKRAARDILNSSYAIALTGAGISTDSGIPDFRGPKGVWTLNPEAERQAYQTYHTFLNDPKEYWEMRLTKPLVLGDIGSSLPNKGHLALAELEEIGHLQCVITQNVDGLHVLANSQHVIEYHGSLHKLRCPSCSARFPSEDYDFIKLREEGKLPPYCPKCGRPLKDDVVHFNEPIPGDVIESSIGETEKCDLMLICGTSAVVYPFAQLPRLARERRIANRSGKSSRVVIIEVNADPTPLTSEGISDYLIQGSTSDILPEIVKQVATG